MKNKNLIFCAFAFKEGWQTSLQTGKAAGHDMTEMYLKNIFVALTSAKLYNSNDDVCLATNYELSPEWKERFAGHSLQIEVVPFDTFEIPRRFPWSLAFYKLCALNAMAKRTEYEHILLLDADTYTTGPYEELWMEADYGILLYPVNHSFHHSDREIIRKDYLRFYPEEAKVKNVVHYGGEFVAGTPVNLEKYLTYCLEVYGRLKAADYEMQPHAGDETVWSVAAARAGRELEIIGAGPYMYRFWTGDFYLISTVTVSNPVCVWHIPNEKQTGFLRLYKIYRKRGAYPPVSKAAKIFGIRKAKRPANLYTLQNKLGGKVKKLLRQ